MDTADSYCNQAPLIPMLTTPRDSFDYNMCHKNRGICLILDHENFSRKKASTKLLPKRSGTDVDADSVETLFGKKLGFTVSRHKDLQLSAVQCVLKQTANLDHSDNDCFVCVVLTHGDHGELYAYDGKYQIELLYKYFLNSCCPTLVGKPKIFFIQACQGNRLDNGVIVQSRDALDSIDSVSYLKIPTHADFLCAYSTLPGFYSFRNTQKGAWFIRALVEVLVNYHEEYDLLTMMTMVCQRVAYDYSSHAITQAMSEKKQVPCITSMLTRRVFFIPKSIQL